MVLLLAYLDSKAYLSLAELSFLDPNFWLGWRPIGLPLIFKIMGTGFLFCVFQTLVYLFSWLFFYRSLKIVNTSKFIKTVFYLLLFF